MNKRFPLFLSMIVIVSLMLAACGGGAAPASESGSAGSGKPVTISMMMWGDPANWKSGSRSWMISIRPIRTSR